MTIDLLSGPVDPAEAMRAKINELISAVNAGLGAGGTRIASGEITAGSLSVVLPPGFVKFEIELINVTLSATGLLAAAFSVDGGGTFLGGTADADTYFNVWSYHTTGTPPTTLTPDSQVFLDGLMDLSGNVDATAGDHINLRMAVYPMSFATAVADFNTTTKGATSVGNIYGSMSALAAAVVTPSTSPINAVVFRHYGDGLIPNMSGDTITGGSYAVRGVVG